MLPDALRPLDDLAFDLRWAWTQSAEDVWRAIDERAWNAARNPRLLLQHASRERLEQLARDSSFVAAIERIEAQRRAYYRDATWFDTAHPDGLSGCAVYLSMEFGAVQALPIYAGGLGVLAADVLKAASDLGVPLVGIGLLYQHGYFRQTIDARGEQHEVFPQNDPAAMPIAPLYGASGQWIAVEVPFPHRRVRARVWEARIGRVTLYLLDCDDPANAPADRAITAQLYGGDQETRLRQELILGIGGWRLVEQLHLPAVVCHLNEGHAAFAVLERARSLAARKGIPFAEALHRTRGGTVFTTHTSVPAGFDKFDRRLMSRYFRDFAKDVRTPFDELYALGLAPGESGKAPFNMAYLAVRGSGSMMAVSALHERVTRRIFEPLFGGTAEPGVPIGHVTNGVHVPTWTSTLMDRDLAAIDDAELWKLRTRMRGVLAAKLQLDPDTMLIGLARRFTGYKRMTLLLSDPDRLVRILNDPHHPVQLVIAGKAHPRDTEGKEHIRRWVEFTRRPDVNGRARFLPDYDLALGASLTQGVDLWINTPRRPWEACGTSGMKVLMNGGLNVSTLDGWWDEAYTPQAGWAIGGRSESDDAAIDDADAQQLYHMLEHHVIPAFYDRDAAGVPAAWVAKMRASLLHVAPHFSAERMVREYVEHHYLPAARPAMAARI